MKVSTSDYTTPVASSSSEKNKLFKCDVTNPLLKKENLYEQIKNMITSAERKQLKKGGYVEVDSFSYLHKMTPFLAFYKHKEQCAIYCVTEIKQSGTKHMKVPMERTISGFFLAHVLNYQDRKKLCIEVTNLVHFKNLFQLSGLLNDYSARSYNDGKNKATHFFVMKEGYRRSSFPRLKPDATEKQKKEIEEIYRTCKHGPFFICKESYLLKLNQSVYDSLKLREINDQAIFKGMKARATSVKKSKSNGEAGRNGKDGNGTEHLIDQAVLTVSDNEIIHIREELNELFKTNPILDIIFDCIKAMIASEMTRKPRPKSYKQVCTSSEQEEKGGKKNKNKKKWKDSNSGSDSEDEKHKSNSSSDSEDEKSSGKNDRTESSDEDGSFESSDSEAESEPKRRKTASNNGKFNDDVAYEDMDKILDQLEGKHKITNDNIAYEDMDKILDQLEGKHKINIPDENMDKTLNLLGTESSNLSDEIDKIFDC